MQRDKLRQFIPDGVRRKFFSIVIDDLIEAFEGPYGEHILGAVLSKRLSPRYLIKSLPNQVNGRAERPPKNPPERAPKEHLRDER